MMLTGLGASLLLFLFQALAPDFALVRAITDVVSHIDFVSAVIGYMLAFLLFAGSMQVDLTEMRRRWLSVGILATVGVAATTIIVGFGLWGIARALELPLTLPWALVFGALISPTDPGRGSCRRSSREAAQGASGHASRRSVVQRRRRHCRVHGVAWLSDGNR